MVQLTLTNKHKRVVSVVMMAAAAFLLTDFVYQARMHAAWNEWLPETLADATATTQPAEGDADKKGKEKKGGDKENKKAKDYEMHASLKKRNVYQPVRREHHGLKLTGIIGKTALFNKGAIEEGKSGHGVKLVKIDGFEVTIEYKGKEEKMRLFDKKTGGSDRTRPAHSPRPARSGPRGPQPSTVSARPAEIRLPEGIPPEHLERIRAQMRKHGMPEGAVIIHNGGSVATTQRSR